MGLDRRVRLCLLLAFHQQTAGLPTAAVSGDFARAGPVDLADIGAARGAVLRLKVQFCDHDLDAGRGQGRDGVVETGGAGVRQPAVQLNADAVNAQALELGLKRMALISSDEAIHLYRRLGYRPLLYFSAFRPVRPVRIWE